MQIQSVHPAPTQETPCLFFRPHTLKHLAVLATQFPAATTATLEGRYGTSAPS